MPGRTRLYSEFLAQDSELDSNVTLISANRVPLTTRLVGGNVGAPSVSPDFGPLFKRHKTMGLNARFDRMIERVNLTLQDPQTPSTTSSRRGQVQARSAGSSSVSSSNDVPKTPMDAYGGLQKGSLVHKFSVIKRKSGSKIGTYYGEAEGYDGSSDMQFEQSDRIDQVTVHKEPPPAWLFKAFSTLDPQNPLRRLVPSSAFSIPDSALPHEESIFAFSHIPQDQDMTAGYQDSSNSAMQVLSPMVQHSHSPVPLPIYPPSPIMTRSGSGMLQAMTLPSSDDEYLPLPDINDLPLAFSVPGPSSTVSLVPSHGDPRSAVNAQAIDQAHPGENDVWPLFSMPGPLTHPPIDRTARLPLVQTLATHTHHPAVVHPQTEPDLERNYVPTLPSSPFLYADFATDSFNSDRFPIPNDVHQRSSTTSFPPITKPFSMPGPRFHIPLSRPIYFDSPTEDPSDSNPLEGYELDELDFRWEPFMQNDVDVRDAERMHGEWDSSLDIDIMKSTEDPVASGFEVRGDTFEIKKNKDRASMIDPGCHLSYGQLSPHLQDREHNNGAQPTITPELKKFETAFVPRPGIFLSSLATRTGSQTARENDIKISLKKSNSKISIPITPKNKSNTLSITIATPTRKSTLKSRLELHPNQTTSRPSHPLPDASTSRTAVTKGQVTREASNARKGPESAKEKSIVRDVFSQTSNDTIKSWSENSDG